MKKTNVTLTVLALSGLLALAVVTGCQAPRAGESADVDPPASLEETVAELVEREVTLREAERERAPAVVVASPAPRPAPSPAPAPAPEPETIAVDLVAGTVLDIELGDALSSDTNLAGDPVRARLASPVVADGVVVVRTGAVLTGEVVETIPSKKFGGKSLLTVRFDLIDDGAVTLPIEAFLVVEGRGQKKKDAATIAGAAAGGAVLGRILGNDDKTESTAIGAVVGAAIGTAVAAKNANDPAIVEAGTIVGVALESPVRADVVVEDGSVVAILTP